MLKEIFEQGPSLVHLSCGPPNSVFCLDRKAEKSVPLQLFAEHIASYYESERVWMVILSGCLEESHAQMFQEKNNCVIYISDKVSPAVTQFFCNTFYSTLAQGKTIRVAYRRAHSDVCGGDGVEEDWILCKDHREVAQFSGIN